MEPDARETLKGDPINRLPIFLRAYVERKTTNSAEEGAAKTKRRRPTPKPSPITLIFDTETTTDAAQRLRIGAYQLRRTGSRTRRGLFYDPGVLTSAELELLTAEAERHGHRLITVREFVDLIIFREIYDVAGTIVGFNLPFDLSRIAIGHGSARRGRPIAPGEPGSARFQRGFTFSLSGDRRRPPLRVRHVNQHTAFIEFGELPGARTPKALRKRGLYVPSRKGFFVDVKTLAKALTSEAHSLASLSRALKVATPKSASDEHGAALTADYIAYAIGDVQSTWECYEALAARYVSFGLGQTRIERIYSEAGLGKAYLKEMGIRPWREAQPAFDPTVIGQMMSTYFGGRAEVNIRRQITQVLHCDFLSMYATVSTLMGLWRFVTAQGARMREAAQEVQAWLEACTPEVLGTPEAWKGLTVLVQVQAEDDVFPVRARYSQSPAQNIAVNRLTSSRPLWFTLADCAASKILTGRAPKVVRAIAFEPGPAQPDLKPICISGNAAYGIDPAKDDFYRRLIDLRREVRAKAKSGSADSSALVSDQLALKILASSTAYGIFVEFNPENLDDPEDLIRYGVDGAPTPIKSRVYEEPGQYFHPLLATVTTGAARLMLALTERLALDQGLDWVFCDTDSMALAKPEGMDDATFYRLALEVRDWFGALNPYAVKGPILQIEDANYAVGRVGDVDAIQPLYCYAVSAKRYALFNLGADGAPVIRKASAHGLGHLLAPYPDPDKSTRIAATSVEKWQEDLWLAIINSAMAGDGVRVPLDFHAGMASPAASRYAATTPALLSWFQRYNEGRPYEAQVRPFNFLLSYQALKLEQLAANDPDAAALWMRQRRDPRPAAPYELDPVTGAGKAFDRENGEPVPARWLETYARNLAQYHLHPEAKFWGGQWTEAGRLRRRHVQALAVQHIGKEADRWEEQQYVGAEDDDQAIEYGFTAEDRVALVAAIREAKSRFGVRSFRKAAGVSDHTIADALKAPRSVADAVLAKLANAADELNARSAEAAALVAELVERVRETVERDGVQAVAARLGYDAANLRKVLAGLRKPSRSLLERMKVPLARA